MSDHFSLPASTRPSVIVLAFVLLLGVACGGDDDGASGDTPAAMTTVPGSTVGPTTTSREPGVTDPALTIDHIGGLEQPTQVVFLGDDDMLVSQKTGEIVRVRDGEVRGPVATLKANYADERGALGLALHPDFAQNHFVYVFWTWTGEGTPPDGLFGAATDDIDAVPANGNRIDRFLWDGETLQWDQNIIELPSRTTDLGENQRLGNNNGGAISFGPDGKLYATIGDQNMRGQLQNVADGLPPRETGLVGVVLRLNDDGSVPLDNPFVALRNPLDKVYLYGLRNSRGFDFDPKTGQFWLEMSGQRTMDVIGRYPQASNAGWIQVMGPESDAAYELYVGTETEASQLGPIPSPPTFAEFRYQALEQLFQIGDAQYVPPLFSWRASVTPLALTFVEGAGLGPAYDGIMLVGDVRSGSIYQFELTEDRMDLSLDNSLSFRMNENSDQNLVGELSDQVFAANIRGATDIEQGPDGTLWITASAQNAIYHITPAD